MNYIIRRVSYMLVTLVLLSFVSFVIIELPPGDYLSNRVASLQQSNRPADQESLEILKRQYGLDRPFMYRYFRWFGNMLKGDLGDSFHWERPVTQLLAERLPLTMILTFSTTILVYLIGIPIAIYSATHQYSVGDYAVTALGFLGIATPNFLLALILMYFLTRYFGWGVVGLFSRDFINAPWSWARIVDLMKHLPVPIIVLGTAGTAGIIRTLRATLLDELRKQYVVTARAKGVSERVLLFKYPLRIAMNPMISTIGGLLPALFAGETIVSMVLGLPTVGPLLFEALRTQDMYLAGSIVMILGALTVVGVLLADLMLMVVDPRIRYGRGAA